MNFSGGCKRLRSGSLGGFEPRDEEGDPSCSTATLCSLPGTLALLGGRRASVSQDRWVCPNDRQLALRAKLSMGWSTGQTTQQVRQEALSEKETKKIMDVIRKAEELEVNEQQRVGRLVQKVEKMKTKRLGNGSSTCILCGGGLPLLRTYSLVCADCNKGVCSKCGIEVPSGTGKETLWLCKICSETREMWKRSGAWFFRGIPKHIIPGRRQRSNPRRWNTLGVKGAQEIEIFSDEKSKKKVQQQNTDDFSDKKSQPSTSPRACSKTPFLTSDSSSLSARTSPVLHRSEKPTENDPRKSPVSPAYSQKDNPRIQNPSEEPGVHHWSNQYAGGGSTACPSSPRSEFKRESDRSPSPLMLRGSWKDSKKHSSNNSSLSDSSISFSREDPDGEGGGGYQYLVTSSQNLVPGSPGRASFATGPVSSASSTLLPAVHSTNHYHLVASGNRSPLINGFRDSNDSNDSSVSKDSVRDEAESISSDDVFPASVSEESCSFLKSPKSNLKGPDSLGYLDFSLLYDSHHQALHCTIHSATELKVPDGSATVDPYVKLHLLPGPSKSNKLRTRTCVRTLNPNFNETLTYHGICEQDMLKKTLRLMVLDEDRFKHDCLGEVRILLSTLRPHESRRIKSKLERKVTLADDERSTEIELGKILLSLKYSSQRGSLLVGVVRCAHLPSMDANGFSDPYVKVQLKQSKVLEKKFKTTTKWKNLNPEYNEEFAFEMKRNELPKKSLEVKVYDKDVGRSDDFIGGVVFSAEGGSSAIRHWYNVINYPDRRHDRWHALQNIK